MTERGQICKTERNPISDRLPPGNHSLLSLPTASGKFWCSLNKDGESSHILIKFSDDPNFLHYSFSCQNLRTSNDKDVIA